MDTNLIIGIINIILIGTTPLIFAAIGELVVEKSGVLNLGLEGMMLVGAVSAFVTLVLTGNYFFALIISIVSGLLMSGFFAFLVLYLMANQVATGLALTIFGIGISSMIGKNYIGTPIEGMSPYFFIVISIIIVFLIGLFFKRTKMGLIVKAVGESHSSAHSLGFNVIKIRFLSILFGGSMSALAGFYMSICYAPMWQEGMIAGRGWIALALVVFATWKAERILLGAYIFGGVAIMQMNLQAFGIKLPGQFFNMLPYIVTILVLVIISGNKLRIKMSAPSCLSIPFNKNQ
ncbi:MAG: ABC transporter permease [Pelagibacteraceae bacterium]|nr:ABC transporter permease [Pelagibacteraceae bacterium]|tara:strand:- start:116 stop:985 length:870 start_codon:yes stop_codon:yes gene_type:complete